MQFAMALKAILFQKAMSYKFLINHRYFLFDK